jgi:putative ATP-dependent endonuclease of OLD family
MKVLSVHIRRFRSIENGEMTNCGGLNVLIGKNNSGKSNLLSTVDTAQRHLNRGSLAGPWDTKRPQDEFTNRATTQPVQIGLEYELAPDLNDQLRELLQKESPHLEKSIEQLKGKDKLSIIIAGLPVATDGARNPKAFLFVETIAVGSIVPTGENLETDGIRLLKVSSIVASQLFRIHQEAESLRADVQSMDRLLQEPYRIQSILEREGRPYGFGDIRPHLSRELTRLAATITDREEFTARLASMRTEIHTQIDVVHHRETENAMDAFAGATKSPPTYAIWLMKQYGAIKMLHLRETRESVGRDEADALLNLKVTRGGPERLRSVQRTVKSLLGVEIDAFQAEDVRRPQGRAAEIDIDRFLIDANGAGIREALRVVLDLELKEPQLVLIEEPEVHLHPGLEHAVYQYLRDKSREIQIFVTTHSTSFVDSISFQNTYLVSKDMNMRTLIRALDTGDGPMKLPSELGLRLSTVFMFDRLVFVEGPSDEAVLRELCKTLDLDIATANVGFVQMGGVRNFAHFAAQATIELLSRRQVQMWFIADRDERDDADVKRMMSQLGSRARLHILKRRELENYLLDAEATVRFIAQKRALGRIPGEQPSLEQVRGAILAAAQGLRDEVIRLRTHKALLGPVHLTGRSVEGDVPQRIEAAIAELQDRRQRIDSTRSSITAQVEAVWPDEAMECAPGAEILAHATKGFNVSFSKETGDSARLAQLLSKVAIPGELRDLLQDITRL